MKKTVLLFLAFALLLSGCVATDTSLTFNEDKTIDLNIVYSIIKNEGATDEALMGIIESAEEELDEREIDYSFADDEDAFRITVPLRFGNVDEMLSSPDFETLRFIPAFSASEEDGKIAVTLNDKGDLRIFGTITSENIGIDEFCSQTGIDPEKVSVKLSVTVPNGESAQWEITGGSEAAVDLTAKNIYGEGANYTGIIAETLALILVLAAIIAFFAFKKKKSAKKETEEGEGE